MISNKTLTLIIILIIIINITILITAKLKTESKDLEVIKVTTDDNCEYVVIKCSNSIAVTPAVIQPLTCINE